MRLSIVPHASVRVPSCSSSAYSSHPVPACDGKVFLPALQQAACEEPWAPATGGNLPWASFFNEFSCVVKPLSCSIPCRPLPHGQASGILSDHAYLLPTALTRPIPSTVFFRIPSGQKQCNDTVPTFLQIAPGILLHHRRIHVKKSKFFLLRIQIMYLYFVYNSHIPSALCQGRCG